MDPRCAFWPLSSSTVVGHMVGNAMVCESRRRHYPTPRAIRPKSEARHTEKVRPVSAAPSVDSGALVRIRAVSSPPGPHRDSHGGRETSPPRTLGTSGPSGGHRPKGGGGRCAERLGGAPRRLAPGCGGAQSHGPACALGLGLTRSGDRC
ncbi:hypothetical protein BV20DRAFT_633404 [Pilatotrama ljubarskyi]|nr:hypothetical protein BV20DRAFT_633404 [Pilatotrama ljubarskyi]